MDARVLAALAGNFGAGSNRYLRKTGDCEMASGRTSLKQDAMSRARCRGAWSGTFLAVVTAIVALVPASSAASATSGLVAAYGFEASSGGIAADTSGNGNDGTIAHATWTTSGAFGSALRVDGSGPGVVVGDSPSLHLKQALTLEAWVKPAAVSSAWRDVVYKGDDNYYLEATSSQGGTPAAGGVFAGRDRTGAFGTAALATGTWTYLAATYDRSNIRLYVDGVEVSSVPETGPIRSSGQPLEIGGDGIYGQFFDGLVDEVRVYDVARTADEIRADMITPVVAGTPPVDVEPPSAPGTLSARVVSSGEVDLSWGAASDQSEVVYELERCLGSGCTDFAALAMVAATDYRDTSVAADSTYVYRVRAVDGSANVGPYSNTAEAITPASSDTEPPSAPGTLSARVVSSGEVDLSWGAASDQSEVVYELERCLGSGCTDFAALAMVAATDYRDTSVAADSTYVYRVRAVDGSANVGPYSNTAEAITPASSGSRADQGRALRAVSR